MHHDALEFLSGKIVLLTHMPEGHRATVLQLPAGRETVQGINQERVSVPA
jgi:hypothetical protein